MEPSMRPTTLVFIIQLLFNATLTLDCRRNIGFCRKLYLISSVTQNEHLFTFEQSFYAELQHFPGGSYLNGEIFVCLYLHKTVLSRFLKRGFSRWIRSTRMETSFESFEKILVPISSHDNSFCILIQLFDITYFRQHLHTLISEGTTNL